jgi:hypothetical protein
MLIDLNFNLSAVLLVLERDKRVSSAEQNPERTRDDSESPPDRTGRKFGAGCTSDAGKN